MVLIRARKLAATMFGPMNVTRAVLPIMRAQRAGLIITISSTAGILGQEFCTAYAASNFGLEGWMESLQPEIEPFGVHTMIVNPGFFRTNYSPKRRRRTPRRQLKSMLVRNSATVDAWNRMNGKQGGDPVKLARAVVQLASLAQPPSRFVAGADAVEAVKQGDYLLAAADAHAELSSRLSFDHA
jgi:NAD(P)-dependent dehydrogenase (short-subunit alcohol dehydrogenase family)